MLKLVNPGTGEALPAYEVAFNDTSEAVARDVDGDPKHHRVIELGGAVGDLLLSNMSPLAAEQTVKRLAESIQPPERSEFFVAGAMNRVEPAVQTFVEELAHEHEGATK